jgi:hypothetical protein
VDCDGKRDDGVELIRGAILLVAHVAAFAYSAKRPTRRRPRRLQGGFAWAGQISHVALVQA